ncbi:MAG: Mur ligase domain-containing protein [Candidatus Krumholzibacteriia bacterium]
MDDTPRSLPRNLHFVGVGGSGMSALAQLHALAGHRVTGSDRAFDAGERGEIRSHLERTGVTILPQDGSGPRPGTEAAVLSTAVEEGIPDVRAARERGVALWHRSELLSAHVRRHRTVAVTGTSGKSTVTAMIFAILRGAGADPGLLTGGPLVDLQAEGYLGNAWAGAGAGAGGWLVVEADESDGTLVRYRPWAGVILNLGRDHKEPAEVAAMFATFRDQVEGPLIVGEDPALDFLRVSARGAAATTFGLGAGCDLRADQVRLSGDGSRFSVEGVEFVLHRTGRHDVLNALAALAAGRACGVDLDTMVQPLARFGGVTRRFQSLGTAAGVEVVDDFAHNADKIAAALAAARARLGHAAAASAAPTGATAARPDGAGGRVLVAYQPHGFGPTRFLRDDLIAAFAAHLRGGDVLWLPEIYYAGGSVTRDISSRDLAEGIRARGRDARFLPDRDDLPATVAAEARPGDLVLIMGARDPSLTGLGRAVLAAVAAAGDPGPV